MDSDTFREALSHWASTVAIAAVDDDGQRHGLTVTSFTPLSADPPRVMISLGPNARLVPFVRVGGTLGISLLHEKQRRLASDHADSFQVGPDPFLPGDPPLVRGAMVGLGCRIRELVRTDGDTTLVIAEVETASPAQGRPLLYHRRGYASLAEDEA